MRYTATIIEMLGESADQGDVLEDHGPVDADDLQAWMQSRNWSELVERAPDKQIEVLIVRERVERS